MAIRLKGLVDPQVPIHDLGITVLKDQIISLTTVQYGASKNVAALVKGALLEIVIDPPTAAPSVSLSDVNPQTFNLRDQAIKKTKVDTSFLNAIDSAVVIPLFVSFPNFNTTGFSVNPGSGPVLVPSWPSSQIYYKGNLYTLPAGHFTFDEYALVNNSDIGTFWVLTLNDDLSVSYRVEALPFTPAPNEVIALFADVGGVYHAMVFGINITGQRWELDGLILGGRTTLFGHVDFQLAGHDPSVAPVGAVCKTGGVTPEMDIIHYNLTATTDPGVNNGSGDSTPGPYQKSSIWINTLSHAVFMCVDPTGGAAVWVQLG